MFVVKWPREQGPKGIQFKGFALGPSLIYIVLALDQHVLSTLDPLLGLVDKCSLSDLLIDAVQPKTLMPIGSPSLLMS